MQLPTTPQEPNLTPTAFKWLIMSQQGMGKSSLLASIPNILIIDPDNGCQALPGYVIQVRNWADCKELLRELQKPKALERYSWLGADLLNILYEFAYISECKRMGVVYPSDIEGGKGHGKGWAMITGEFISWVRDLGNLGLPFIATCHINMTEVTIKNRKFNRAIPSFVGSGTTSTYQRIKQAFDIIGYLTFDVATFESTEKDIRKAVDPDTHTINLAPAQELEFTETRVIHFQPSQYWEAEDTSRQLPAKVVLPSDWREDWNTILINWGKEEE